MKCLNHKKHLVNLNYTTIYKKRKDNNYEKHKLL